MSRNDALINKDTLRFIREQKRVSPEYVERVTNIKPERLAEWEDSMSDALPTINQAKALAKCYRVPFAGLYMDKEDININHLPRMFNKRTMVGVVADDSAVNLALIDLINDRQFYLESKELLNEEIPAFDFNITSLITSEWARMIREYFGIKLADQYKTPSKRQFYLYLRGRIESKGIFVQGFRKVDVSVLRGVAICDGLMPIIGVNEEDRPPAKSFSIIHELVHIIKKTSTICNDLFLSNDAEEAFCNAVAGETLVPKAALYERIKGHEKEIDIDAVDSLAEKFSVSSEVIARRLHDCFDNCGQSWYRSICAILAARIEKSREERKLAKEMGLTLPFGRHMDWEAIDRTSTDLCRTLLHGYSADIFDKADISARLGIGEKHIDNFLMEVLAWQ